MVLFLPLEEAAFLALETLLAGDLEAAFLPLEAFLAGDFLPLEPAFLALAAFLAGAFLLLEAFLAGDLAWNEHKSLLWYGKWEE